MMIEASIEKKGDSLVDAFDAAASGCGKASRERDRGGALLSVGSWRGLCVWIIGSVDRMRWQGGVCVARGSDHTTPAQQARDRGRPAAAAGDRRILLLSIRPAHTSKPLAGFSGLGFASIEGASFDWTADSAGGETGVSTDWTAAPPGVFD